MQSVLRRTVRAAVCIGLAWVGLAAWRASGAARSQHKPSPRHTTARASDSAAAQRAAVRRWMHSLSLRDRIAQMVVMPCYAEKLSLRSRAYRDYRRQIHVDHIGGLIILGRVVRGAVQPADPKTVADFVNQMQNMAAVPLLVAADFERGLSNRVSHSAPWPHNMAFGAAGDIGDVRYQAAVTAKEARAVGVQWIFAPDADVNSNPDNPIINIRSYGENPAEVSRFVRAYIEGAHSDPANPVLVTVKHFPGQGNSSVDSHLGLARNSDSREQLEQIDLPPFREGIAAGVDAVMAAHMALPAIETEEIPATVSRAILTGLLREEMKFQGLAVTDAMDMQGLTKLFNPSEAAVRAVEAGADVLLMPRNAEETVNAVLKAVQSGRISRARIDESVTRILSAKARTGLQHTRHVNIARLDRIMDSAESEARAQSVADRAITLVKNDGGLVPLPQPDSACVTVLAESDSGSEGPHLIDEFKKRAPGMKTQLLDPGMSAQALDDALNALAGCPVNVAAVYSTRFDNTGAAWLRGDFPSFLTKMLAGKTPVIVLGIGIPYFARSFSGIGTYIATLSSSESSETAVVRALFGEIGMSGKLPVTIPGFAAAGAGIDVAAKGK